MKSWATGNVNLVLGFGSRIVIGFGIASALAGCTGQTVDGAWRGPFPLQDGTDCIMKLFPDRRFELSCPHYRWVAAGHWKRSGDALHIDLDLLTESGVPHRPPLPTYDFAIDGRGNEMCLDSAAQGRFCWQRVMR